MTKECISPIEKLRMVMACLRDPDYGCPWDLEQTPSTIAPHTLEEAYEVVDAIESGDAEHLKEELGDLLLQIIFYCQMSEEESQFSFDEVTDGIVEKLLRRHPHVFPDGTQDSFGKVSPLRNASDVEVSWEAIKAKEKSVSKSSGILGQVEKGLPSMIRARKLQKAAKKVGFDWPNIEPALDKIEEETQELREAINKGYPSSEIEEEFGDLLFASMNVSRFLKIDPEMALVRANRKFEARIHCIEGYIAKSNKDWGDYSLEELDMLWEKAKKELVDKKHFGAPS
ncbi:MAG: nucleoside triphosphate pyrophosphohydrolase [Gammaproteobacteria bacterium]|nr:nucleoside triphosphate pyrophosphohydrolase [Gammaproteobacteria bacterium]